MDSVIEPRLSSDVEKQTARFTFRVNKYLNISKYFGSVQMIHTKDYFVVITLTNVSYLICILVFHSRIAFCWSSFCISSAFQQTGIRWFTFYAKNKLRTTRLNNRNNFQLICSGLCYHLIFMLLKRM